MKTFYTIVYSPFSAVSQERLNLGMVMLDGQGAVRFRFSQEKLNRARKLFSEEGFKLIKSFLTSIDKKLAHKDELISNGSDFNLDYLSYLSKYSNNLVGFTEPQVIDIELTQNNFDKFYSKYVFKESEKVNKELAPISLVSLAKDSLIPKVKGRMDVDVNLSADKFKFVMFDLHIDMMGKNDRPVLNQFIDFGNTEAKIQKEVTSYLSIVKPFEIQDGKQGKFFLVGDEPSKQLAKQYLMWRHLLESPLITAGILEIVRSNETERIEAYLEEHDVKPYFSDPKINRRF